LTLPMLGAAGLVRVVVAVQTRALGPLWWGLLGAVLIQVLWALGFWGGADAKLFAALWLLWPTLSWLFVWFTVLPVGYLLWRQAQRWPQGAGRLPEAFPALGPVALGAWGYLAWTVLV